MGFFTTDKPKKQWSQANPLASSFKAPRILQQQDIQHRQAAGADAERMRQEEVEREQRRHASEQQAAAERKRQAERASNQIFKGSEYEQMCRQLNDAIDAIRSTGAQHTLDLPQVVVCGNQSAGKSSVLEALCDVRLPRSDGTCTRCPMEVRMASARSAQGGEGMAEPWSATVRVRRTHDRLGNGPIAMPEETVVREGITRKADVEGVVRAAQDMILDSNDAHACLFSRNTVILEIRGAPVSLSLVDLPGIIHAMEPGADGTDYPGLVKGMARDYISRPAAIIVAVVTCKEDLDTQCVLSMAREVDPEGKRTIGVVTKPDCIEPGCHTAWLDVVTGRRWPLRLGYYILKNPAQAQLSMDFSAARAAEAQFFAATPPWSGLASGYASRFGAAALRGSLSKLMAHLISRSLPGLTASAQQQLSEVQAQLARLPPALLPPSTRAPRGEGGRHMEGLRLMTVLLDQISAQLMGQLSATGGMFSTAAFQSAGAAFPLAGGAAANDDSDPLLPPPPVRNLWIDLLQLFEQFKKRVYGTKPHFLVAGVRFTCITDDDVGCGQGGLEGGVSATSMEDLQAGVGQGGLSAHPLAHSTSISVASTASLFGGSHPHGRDQGQARDQDQPAAGGAAQQPVVMTFKEVQELADSQKGLELPGFSPYSAVQALISRNSRSWPGATSDLLHATTASLSALTHRVLASALSRFPAAHSVAAGIAEALVVELNAATATRLKELLVSENACAFTMNRHEFEVLCSATLRQLKEACAQQGEASSAARGTHAKGGSSLFNKASVHPAASGLADALGGSMFSELGRDHVLTMIAVSLTYFKMSSRRVVDGVPLLIMHHLLGSFGPMLRERLMTRMLTGITDSDLHAMLAEDEATRTYRAGLLSKNAMLETAVAELKKASLPLAAGQRLC